MQVEKKGHIASGSFGRVYAAKGSDGKDLVIKEESRAAKYPQLVYEHRVYDALGQVVAKPGLSPRYWGLPAIYSIRYLPTTIQMTMELLGRNLEEMRASMPGGRLTKRTVYTLAIQLIEHIRYMHCCYFLHRDLKPENMLMGVGPKSHIVKLVDMGLTKKYITESGEHIPWETDRPFLGTLRYAPLAAHRGEVSTRANDLESLGYVLAYLLLGRLPWQGGSSNSAEAVLDKKVEKMPAFLKALPPALASMITETQSLPYRHKPSYQTYIRAFKHEATTEGLALNYVYDWTIQDSKRKALLRR